MLFLIYMWCYDYSAKLVCHELRLSNHTVTDYFNMLRELCFIDYPRNEKIGGENIIVQIDESHLFTRKYHVGKVLMSEQFWVFGGVDENGKFFLERVLNRDGETLKEILLRRVNTGSLVLSDSWRGYSFVCDYYFHLQVNHSKFFVSPFDSSQTQQIEATWSVLKRLLRKKGTRKCDNLDYYLAEFLFKQSHKDAPFLSFLRTMRNHFNPAL